MRQSDIEVGYIYYGKTGPYREVVEMFDDQHGERCVRYRYPGETQERGMFLRSFAKWAERGLWTARQSAPSTDASEQEQSHG